MIQYYPGILQDQLQKVKMIRGSSGFPVQRNVMFDLRYSPSGFRRTPGPSLSSGFVRNMSRALFLKDVTLLSLAKDRKYSLVG